MCSQFASAKISTVHDISLNYMTSPLSISMHLFFLFTACHMNITSLNGTINILTPPAKQTNSTRYTCKWNIQLMKVDTPRHVELRFTSFDIAGIMPECFSGNYIELFLGCNPSKSIGKFCGKLSMPVVYSFDHCLQIRLIVASDFRFEGSSLLDGVPYFTAVFNQRLRTKGEWFIKP